MALSNSELAELKQLVETPGWEVYLKWIESRMEDTFQEMIRYETEQDQFIRLQARIRTLMDVTYFFELELFSKPDSTDDGRIQEARKKYISVDKGYAKRFLGIFKRTFGRPE